MPAALYRSIGFLGWPNLSRTVLPQAGFDGVRTTRDGICTPIPCRGGWLPAPVMEITLLGGNWHEKGFPVPECGVGLDSVALAYFESVLLYSVRGLAYQVCLERFKVLNRELVARPARACMGTGGRKRAASSCTRELVRVENQTQMVRSCNRAAFRHTSSIHVGCADAFFRESPSATYVDSSGLLTGTTVRASMGRDSVEGLCFEEAPTSLLSPLVCVDSRRVLGAMACSVMVSDIELYDRSE